MKNLIWDRIYYNVLVKLISFGHALTVSYVCQLNNSSSHPHVHI